MINKDETFELIDEFIDIGYMAEEFEVKDLNDQSLMVHKTAPNRTIQIFLSFPNFEDFKEEILAFDALMSEAVIDINTILLFSQKCELSEQLKAIKVFIDEEGDFGSMYGTKIVSGPLEDKLTKALFLIGKDGAIYHIDMPQSLKEPFDLDRIRIELNRAYQSYTGVGCHG